MNTAPSGTVNGSDLLVNFNGKATGHSTSHTTTFTSETKETAVKPKASVPKSSASKFKNKIVSGLAVQIKAEGLVVYSEDESGLKAFLAKWKVGASVEASCFERENDSAPYVSGNFIITSLEVSSPAGEDTTYNVTLDNDGPVDIDESKFDPDTEEEDPQDPESPETA